MVHTIKSRIQNDFFDEFTDGKQVLLEHIPGELQQADILTKPISVKVHNTLVPTIEHNFAFIVMFKSETGCYASCNSLALRFMDRIGL